LTIGQLVRVPFQSRTLAGLVVDVAADTSLDRVRDVAGLAEEDLGLQPHQLELGRWIAAHYAAPLSDVLAAMIPPRLRARVAKPVAARAGGTGTDLLSLSDEGRAALQNGGIRRAPVRLAVLEYLSRSGPSPETAVVAALGRGREQIRALLDAGLLRREEAAGLARASATLAPQLSQAQQEAVAAVRARPGSTVFLLHGVTGSGKTEVYMAIIADCLARGEGAIVMVPEIALTPQAVKRFSDRFPGLVAVLHSSLSEADRQAEWQSLRSGEKQIAVGPRSALFAPLPRPGVVVVDEEHDPSYKQGESPRYHARDAAVRLGSILNIPVILGSATPDVSTYYQARRGGYVLLELPDRPVWPHSGQVQSGEDGIRSMPPVEIVDLRQELKAGNRSIFSRALLDALHEVFRSRHQALLFLNRRGSATAVVCRDCGYVATCDRCDIPLTYHSSRDRLICHRCDRRLSPPDSCPACHGTRIRYLGAGTQRVVEEVERLIPTARVLRWDRDVTGRRGAHERIAATFDRHDADILVGTQMITKGLDFPLVTLVGVVLADVGLHLPDFRAGERTFQLITQVAGRAGRSHLASRVIVQAYTPHHYALQAAMNHDYWSFYRQEMTFRHESGYPPFTRMARIILRDRRLDRLTERAQDLAAALTRSIADRGLDLEVMGPAPAFVARVNEVHQWHLIIRGLPLESVLDVVPSEAAIDVDPVDLL